jgi:glucose-6-phosphate dehydrogenase assembly protein OpcA
MSTAESPAPANGLLITAHPPSIDNSLSQACLSNLIIYTEDMADQEVIAQTMSQFVVKHPCRLILILSSPRQAGAKIDAEVSAHTYTSASGKNAVCEQITIRACGGGVRELASAVQPLLVPDLPVYLWWRGLFLEQRNLVEQMLTFADRFIYDGVNWTNLHYTVLQVSDFFERYQTNVGFTNFNWSRLRPWRENAANFFDVGLFEKEIWDMERVAIEFMALPGKEEGFQFRALLFVSWLAVQLEWVPQRGIAGTDKAQLHFQSKKGKPVDAELIMLPQSTPTAQSIQRVIMNVDSNGKKQELSIERDHTDHVEILVTNGDAGRTVMRKVPHLDSSIADLLYRELGRRGRNRVFERSFKMAAKLLQMI